MRIIFCAITLTLWAACAAYGQNSDLGLLAGIATPRGSSTVSGTSVSASGSVSPSFQVNYAWQAHQAAVDLYVEVPFVVTVRETGVASINGANISTTGNSDTNIFFTPGVRFKFSPQSRVSVYAAAGFGLASFGSTVSQSSVIGTAVSASSYGKRSNSPAAGFGGGLDIRLTRLLSIRGDLRDFVTEKNLGGIAGRNHGIFQAGIAFHF
jgi:hypothetical protein